MFSAIAGLGSLEKVPFYIPGLWGWQVQDRGDLKIVGRWYSKNKLAERKQCVGALMAGFQVCQDPPPTQHPTQAPRITGVLCPEGRHGHCPVTLFILIYLLVLLFFGCIGSSLLHTGFL